MIGITEEQREQMIELYYKQKNIERKHPSKEELEKEIIDYLGKNHPCSLATCGKDGTPRISVVDYMNDGLTIYILSEGGKKFQNISLTSLILNRFSSIFPILWTLYAISANPWPLTGS